MMAAVSKGPTALELALSYAARMWPVAPAHNMTPRGCSCGGSRSCSPGKHPRTVHGLEDATTDENQIREWWSKWPDANVMIRTGMVGDRCLVVLDIDPKHNGDESLQMLEARHGVLPMTPRAITGSGGQHFFFWSSKPVRNSTSKLAEGIDTRGVGGYVIAAPSTHESGANYVWDAGAHPDDIPLAEAPDWLVAIVGKPSVAERLPVANAFIEGGRNNALAKLAGSMRRGGVSQKGIEAALLHENDARCRPPLDPREVQNIARSIARYEPTDAPEGTTPRKALTFADVVAMWNAEGPVVRAPTGWETFDAAARGGLAFGRRCFIVGAPNAGKTAVLAHLANRYWREGHVVGILAVDEEPDDVTARFAQMAGFALEDTESGDPRKLAEIGEALRDDGVFLYDHGWTIEAAAEDLGAHARAAGKKAVFVVDSVQTARSQMALKADGPRMVVMSNVQALKAVTSANKFLLLCSSEMGRGGYANEEAAKNFNDMAAGKESGDVEYAAAVQIVLRSVKGAPGIIRVKVPKLKRGKSDFEFFLSLNKHTHNVTERPEPLDDEQNIVDAKAMKQRRQTQADASALRDIILRKPGIGELELRGEWQRQGLGGNTRLLAAKSELGPELGKRDARKGKVEYFIQLPDSGPQSVGV